MKDLESNKILAAIIIATLIAVVSGKIASTLYHDGEHEGATEEKRGYQVEVATENDSSVGTAESAEPVDIIATLQTGGAAAGESTFKKCASCHSVEQGKHKVGPSLHGIIGASKAGHAEFAYSDALKAKGGNWTYEDIYHFINNPKDFVPGTKMTFMGLKKPQDIANIIAYMRQHTENPPPIQ